jgi:hypothetical protein
MISISELPKLILGTPFPSPIPPCWTVRLPAMISPNDDVRHQSSSSGVSPEIEKQNLLQPISPIESPIEMQVVGGVSGENEKTSKSLPPVSTLETSRVVEVNSVSEPVRYRLYRQRFVGLIALVRSCVASNVTH